MKKINMKSTRELSLHLLLLAVLWMLVVDAKRGRSLSIVNDSLSFEHEHHHHHLPYCTNNSHIDGKWFYNATKDTKSFLCCGWYEKDYMWNPQKCGWNPINSEEYSGMPPFYTLFGDQACVCDRNGGTRMTVSEREKYYWKPHTCKLRPFNGTDFCHILGARTILFLGDSTMQQTLSTLASMIYPYKVYCEDQLKFYRIDRLYEGMHGRIKSIEAEVDIKKPDILVLSTGAHFHAIDEYHVMWQNLQPRLIALHQQHPNMTIAWKTISPGHFNCSNPEINNRPLKRYIPMMNETLDVYQWRFHRDFDLISKDYTNPNGPLSFVKFMDIYPLYYRLDAHFAGDCLHYCAPGAMDFIAELIYNMLKNKEL